MVVACATCNSWTHIYLKYSVLSYQFKPLHSINALSLIHAFCCLYHGIMDVLFVAIHDDCRSFSMDKILGSSFPWHSHIIYTAEGLDVILSFGGHFIIWMSFYNFPTHSNNIPQLSSFLAHADIQPSCGCHSIIQNPFLYYAIIWMSSVLNLTLYHNWKVISPFLVFSDMSTI